MEIDYKKLKFKSGLEIHQQLDTGKLFCKCPSVLRSDDSDFEIKRKLHAVAGESGEVDIAAKHQATQDKEFIYRGHYENSCLVELDEEPPHEINMESLKIAVQIALLMNMKIIPITQIMRKTVIDGSNTTGFQRTVLIARDGFIEVAGGKVGIDYIYLEEDSARNILREENKEIYNLDRLGIPLVEIVTSPEVKNAGHAKEVALKIGEILRSCRVKRGIGTIRQDVNISIRGENRVEMKGMQNMEIFVDAIEKEILRQKKLSDAKNPTEMEVRNVFPDGMSKFMRPLPGSARMYPETDLPLLKISRELINEAKKELPKLIGDIEDEFGKKGLSKEMIKLIFKQKKVNLFKELLRVIDNPSLIAKVLLIFPKEISKKEDKKLEKVERILEDNYNTILELVAKNKIFENDVKEVMINLVKGKPLDEILKKEKVDRSKIEGKVMKLIKEKPGFNPNAYMGLVMKEFKGEISGKEAMEIIRKFLKSNKIYK
jgi:Glu-tRNA(Gln) amidotransferase subunit E-like FAD-binding protein